MSEPNQSIIIRIPVRFTPKERRLIAQDVISTIRSRTKKGVSRYGTLFVGYSPRYDRSGTPDLSRSGEMLSDLKLLNHGRGFIKIGFLDPQSNDKASFNKINRRDFMGVSRKELSDILDVYK